MGLWNIYGCGIRISTILSYKENYGFRLPNLWNKRQIQDLLMGDFRSAISHNPFTLLSVFYLLLIVLQMKKKAKSTVNIILNLCFLLCYILWGILRNVYGL